jgi:hypothetical protein
MKLDEFDDFNVSLRGRNLIIFNESSESFKEFNQFVFIHKVQIICLNLIQDSKILLIEYECQLHDEK